MNGSLKRIWGWISMLKVQELQVNYGGIRAVKNISFEVPDGSIVTLVGANGAGKSTTLRTIAGQVKAQAGSITYNGEELLGMPSDEIVKRGITLVPEGRRVFPDMTVLENMKIGAYLRRVLYAVPPSEGAPLAAGRYPFRRRAADAGGGPRTDEPSQADDDG